MFADLLVSLCFNPHRCSCIVGSDQKKDATNKTSIKRMTGLIPEDGVRSSSGRNSECRDTAGSSGGDLVCSQTPSRTVFRTCPTRRRLWARPRTQWRDCASWFSWEDLSVPPVEVEEVAEEGEVMDGWMDNNDKNSIFSFARSLV